MKEELLVYTKTGCPYCVKLLDEYRKKGIEYSEVNISQDESSKTLLKEVFMVDKVPVVIKDGKLESIGYLGKG